MNVLVLVFLLASLGFGESDAGTTRADAALLARAEKAVKACGVVSRGTLPPGWQMVMYGNGCTLHAPPSWRVAPQPGTLEVTADASRKTGYFVVTSYVPGEQWTDQSLSEHMVGQLRAEHGDLRAIRSRADDSLAALGAVTRQTHVRFTHDGVKELGEFRVIYTGCVALSGMCALTVMGMWAPEAELSDALCTLLQIDASIRCPTGGSSDCSDSECRDSCRNQGHKNGECVGDRCECR